MTLAGSILRHGLPCVVVWSLYLAAFWPGILTEDSIEQWRDLVTGELRGYHSPLQTLLNRLVTAVWLSPAAVAIAQIVAMALAYAAIVHECERRGARRAWLAGTTAAFAALPANGFLAVTLWKDVPYTVAMLGVVALTLRAMRRPDRLGVGALPWALAAMLTGMATFRHNGLPTAAVVLLALLWALRPPRRTAATLVALAVGGVLLLQGAVFRWLDVQPFHAALRDQTAIHQIAAALRPGTAFDSADYEAIGAAMPVPQWLATYRCQTVIPTLAAVLDARGDAAYRPLRPGLYRAWLHAWLRSPRVLTRHHACVSGLIWHPLATFHLVNLAIVPNGYGLETAPLLPRAHEALVALHRVTTGLPWRPVIWGPALHLALVAAAALSTVHRTRRRAVVLPFVPALAHSLVLLLAIPSAEYRLQYPVVVTGILAPLLAHALRREPRCPAGPTTRADDTGLHTATLSQGRG